MEVLVPIDPKRRQRLLDALDDHETALHALIDQTRTHAAWCAAEAGQCTLEQADDIRRDDAIRPDGSPGFHVAKDVQLAMPAAAQLAESIAGPQVVVVTTSDGVYELECDELVEVHRIEARS